MTDMLRQLREFHEVSRSVLADVRTAHNCRGPGASSEMKTDDRDFYSRLCGMFGENKILLSNYEDLYAVKRPSYVDGLAAELAVLTGNEWEVRRVKHAPDLTKPEKTVIRYVLRGKLVGTDFDYDHHFFLHRPRKLRDMTYLLAMMLDLIHMGFLPLKRPDALEQQPDHSAVAPGPAPT